MIADSSLVAFVASTDLVASDRFYSGVLGLSLVDAGAFANTYDAHGTELRVIRVQEHTAAPFTVLGWAVDDIAAEVDALTELGVEFARYPDFEQDERGVWTAPSGALIAWFHDPDGNTISLQHVAGD